MDYSKLSNKEIAAKVLIAQGYRFIGDADGYSIYISDYGRKDTGPKSSKQFAFDPCNNPADAWPIIFENGISLLNVWDEDGEIEDSTWVATTNIDMTWCGDRERGFESTDKNPLRASMIVYLMMCENDKP